MHFGRCMPEHLTG